MPTEILLGEEPEVEHRLENTSDAPLKVRLPLRSELVIEGPAPGGLEKTRCCFGGFHADNDELVLRPHYVFNFKVPISWRRAKSSGFEGMLSQPGRYRVQLKASNDDVAIESNVIWLEVDAAMMKQGAAISYATKEESARLPIVLLRGRHHDHLSGTRYGMPVARADEIASTLALEGFRDGDPWNVILRAGGRLWAGNQEYAYLDLPSDRVALASPAVSESRNPDVFFLATGGNHSELRLARFDGGDRAPCVLWSQLLPDPPLAVAITGERGSVRHVAMLTAGNGELHVHHLRSDGGRAPTLIETATFEQIAPLERNVIAATVAFDGTVRVSGVGARPENMAHAVFFEAVFDKGEVRGTTMELSLLARAVSAQTAYGPPVSPISRRMLVWGDGVGAWVAGPDALSGETRHFLRGVIPRDRGVLSEGYLKTQAIEGGEMISPRDPMARPKPRRSRHRPEDDR